MICEGLTLDSTTAVKHCTKCGEGKSLSEFSKNKSSRDGRQSVCKPCFKVYSQKYKQEPKILVFQKTCTSCGIVKPSNLFALRAYTKDGRRSECKDCQKISYQNSKNKIKDNVLEKMCIVCNEKLSFSQFSKNPSSKDGLQNTCKSCVKEYNSSLKNKEKVLIEYKICSECNILKSASEYHQDITKIDNLNHMCKECVKEKDAYWHKKNPDKACARTSRRRAGKLKATPPWLDDLLNMQIKWYYAAARMMTETSGVLHHVDHIHPLKGENFSGLHVPWNLRCIKAEDNSKKTNKPPAEELHLFFHPNADMGASYVA